VCYYELFVGDKEQQVEINCFLCNIRMTKESLIQDNVINEFVCKDCNNTLEERRRIEKRKRIFAELGIKVDE
jgi:transcription initiation factor IIE alpha subunit